MYSSAGRGRRGRSAASGPRLAVIASLPRDTHSEDERRTRCLPPWVDSATSTSFGDGPDLGYPLPPGMDVRGGPASTSSNGLVEVTTQFCPSSKTSAPAREARFASPRLGAATLLPQGRITDTPLRVVWARAAWPDIEPRGFDGAIRAMYGDLPRG